MRLPITFILYCICLSYASAQSFADIMSNSRVTIHTDLHQKEIFHTKETKKKARPDKTYYWYATRQVHQTQGGYTSKVLHGDYSLYHPNNQVATQGSFHYGLKDGVWQSWSDAGLLSRSSTWHKGVENGPYKLYNEAGILVEEGQLKQGKSKGKVYAYTDDGLIRTRKYFREGREITKEEYIQQDFFRRSTHYVGQQWQKLFQKKKENQ